jgi:hypothetical protein
VSLERAESLEPSQAFLGLGSRFVVTPIEASIQGQGPTETFDEASGSFFGLAPSVRIASTHAPGVECLIVELDDLEHHEIVRESLREPPRDHAVMVLTDPGLGVIDQTLERVVRRSDDAQTPALFTGSVVAVDVGEHFGDVVDDRTFRMPGPGITL